MKPGIKMLMLTNARKSDSERTEKRKGYYAEDNYPRNVWEDGEWPENRFRDRRGRERYDDGRFAPQNDMEDDNVRRGNYPESHYPMTPYVPPIHQNAYRDIEDRRTNRIGFDANRDEVRIPREMDQEYRSSIDYRSMDEAMPGKGGEYVKGHGSTMGLVPFDEEMATEWTKTMQNEDGTKGPHWTKDQVRQVMSQKGVDGDPVEFWAVINAIYSDDVAVAKKHNVNTIDYYVDRAKAWIKDKDAVQDKAAAYYTYVVKH